MEINATNNQPGNQQNGNAGSALGSSQLGKQDFLQLLVAQLKNQDPINPMEGTEFASQLAQFNSVEQLINLNNGMGSLAQSQQMMNTGLTNTMAASLAGKNVRALSNKVHIGAGQSTDVQFRLNNIATEVQINIRDSSGNIVRTQKLENIGSGDHQWQWDGTTNDGRHVAEGVYQVEIKASNGDSKVGALTFIEGMAEKVKYSSKGVELLVKDISIPLGDIEEIGI